MDELEKMLADKVAGLSPIARTRKLEEIGLAVSKRFAESGDRAKELFWLERAKEARNEGDRLARGTK